VLDARGDTSAMTFRTATRLQKVPQLCAAGGFQALAWSESGGDPGQARCAAREWGPVTVVPVSSGAPGVWPEVDPPPRAHLGGAEHVGLDIGSSTLEEGLRRIAAAGRVDVRDLEASLIRLWLLTIARSQAAPWPRMPGTVQ